MTLTIIVFVILVTVVFIRETLNIPIIDILLVHLQIGKHRRRKGRTTNDTESNVTENENEMEIKKYIMFLTIYSSQRHLTFVKP